MTAAQKFCFGVSLIYFGIFFAAASKSDFLAAYVALGVCSFFAWFYSEFDRFIDQLGKWAGGETIKKAEKQED